jgi:hypothetical protein
MRRLGAERSMWLDVNVRATGSAGCGTNAGPNQFSVSPLVIAPEYSTRSLRLTIEEKPVSVVGDEEPPASTAMRRPGWEPAWSQYVRVSV